MDNVLGTHTLKVCGKYGIRYLANQVGYREEVIHRETGFNDSKVFEI